MPPETAADSSRSSDNGDDRSSVHSLLRLVWLNGELEANIAHLKDGSGCHCNRLSDAVLIHQGAIAAAHIFDPERAIPEEDAGVLGGDKGAVQHDGVGGRAPNRGDWLDIQTRAGTQRSRTTVDDDKMAHDVFAARH